MIKLSAGDVRVQINRIRDNMEGSHQLHYINFNNNVTNYFLSDVNRLMQVYGEFIGKSKAKYPEYFTELNSINDDVTTCFVNIVGSLTSETCYKLLNLAIGKMSEAISYVEGLESNQSKETVSKAYFDKLLNEKEQLEKTAKLLAQYRGIPEVNSLIEKARGIGLPIDENWVLALCALNLIEATVNMKLEQLGLKAEGQFKEKYRKLSASIKEKENRDIFQLLPTALYDGVRNKLDHASNCNKVTENEAKEINKLVIGFMEEVFAPKT